MIKPKEAPNVAILVKTQLEFGRGIIRGILKYSNEIGPWNLRIEPGASSSPEQLLDGWNGDGIIAQIATTSLAARITDSGLPVVNVGDSKQFAYPAPCVRTNDRAGTKLAAEHFLKRGIRNLGFVGPSAQSSYGEAFREALRERDIECHVFEFDRDDPDRSTKLIDWLHEIPKTVGLLVWGQGYARWVIGCCREARINIPHDVAVLGGSHDELLSDACFPAVSGILLPTEQIGYEAARLLHKMMRGKAVANDTTYLQPTGIAERVSTDTLAVDDRQLLQVMHFLREHAFESINMDDILKAVPMARRSLERRFASAFGHSPSEEIRLIRMARARKLLAETTLPMQEIAEACGYATYNHLTNVFKQTTGMPPRDYRKKYRR